MRPEIRFTPPRRARRRIACGVAILGTEEQERLDVTHGLSDTLNVVTKNLTVALGTALAQTLQRRSGQ